MERLYRIPYIVSFHAIINQSKINFMLHYHYTSLDSFEARQIRGQTRMASQWTSRNRVPALTRSVQAVVY